MSHNPDRLPTVKRRDAGKDVEKEVRDWLEAESSADKHFAYHRYPDARAARGALSAQPSDFLVARRSAGNPGVRRAWHLEVKDTQQEARLPKSKVRQYGKLLMFWLAGIEVAVVIHRSTVGDWVLLTERELFSHAVCPPSFLLKDLKSYPTLDSLMKEHFKCV